MLELYTMQRYLQYGELERLGFSHFDCWASTFGETVTALELAPEGTGYRQKTRFSRFYNLPELMSMFKQVADVQTADTLALPTPKVHLRNVAVQPLPRPARAGGGARRARRGGEGGQCARREGQHAPHHQRRPQDSPRPTPRRPRAARLRGAAR